MYMCFTVCNSYLKIVTPHPSNRHTLHITRLQTVIYIYVQYVSYNSRHLFNIKIKIASAVIIIFPNVIFLRLPFQSFLLLISTTLSFLQLSSTLLHLTPLQIVKSFKHEDETGHFVQCIRFVEKLSFFQVSDSLCDTIQISSYQHLTVTKNTDGARSFYSSFRNDVFQESSDYVQHVNPIPAIICNEDMAVRIGRY